MKKRAKLLLVFILLLGGVFLLANHQVEAGNTDIATFNSVKIGDPPRMELFWDSDGRFLRACFDCSYYTELESCFDLSVYQDCAPGWKQAVLQDPAYLCAYNSTDNSCNAFINMNTAEWGPPVGFWGENATWHCCPLSK